MDSVEASDPARAFGGQRFSALAHLVALVMLRRK
jgi:hypothetical protein